MPDEGAAKDGRQELAKERTDWALHRTAFAKERTFNAWLRTGLTAVAAGVGVARLLTIKQMPALTLGLGALLIVAGGTLFAIALWRYRHGYKELREEEVEVLPLEIVVLLLLGPALSLLLIFLPCRPASGRRLPRPGKPDVAHKSEKLGTGRVHGRTRSEMGSTRKVAAKLSKIGRCPSAESASSNWAETGALPAERRGGVAWWLKEG